MKEKKGSIIQTVAGLVILIAGIVLCVNTYVVKGNKAYAVSLLTAIVGAVILISGLYSLFSKNEKKPIDAKVIAQAALCAALCYVGATFIKIDIPVGTERTMFHFGNVFCVLAALLLGGYKVSGGLHGVGASVVNALSEWMEVEVKRNGHIYEQRYERGDVCFDLRVVGDCPAEQTGTKVTFLPDKEIFQETTIFEYDVLKHRLREMAFLTKGIKIVLTDLREGIEQEETFHWVVIMVAWIGIS